jgi:hypothetical protein
VTEFDPILSPPTDIDLSHCAATNASCGCGIWPRSGTTRIYPRSGPARSVAQRPQRYGTV